MSLGANIDLLGVVFPGVHRDTTVKVTTNRKYFAYGASHTVFVYDPKTMKMVNVIGSNGKVVVTLSLGDTQPNLLAISYPKKIVVIDIEKNVLICECSISESIIAIGWTCNDDCLICFSRMYDVYYKVFFKEASVKKVRTIMVSIRVVAFSRESPQFWIGGNRKGGVARVNENGGTESREYPEWGSVVASALDPNCPTNCLIVWNKGALALFDAISMEEMNLVSGLSYRFGSAVWSSLTPGQFLTGDARHGVVRVWNAAGSAPMESITLREPGILVMLELPGDRTLIGFQDGMIGIYDMGSRQYVFQSGPGHTNGIVGTRFIGGSSDAFITVGMEGAVCSWSSSSMKQIDWIPPNEDVGTVYSSDVSPGGGVVVCGCSKGLIMIFSLKTRMLVGKMTVGCSEIMTLSFSQTRPEHVLCVCHGGYTCIVNIEKKQVDWTCDVHGSRLIGSFSPSSDNRWVTAGKGGLVTTWVDGVVEREYTGTVADITATAWSPHESDIIAIGDKLGNIQLWNFRKNRSQSIWTAWGGITAIAFHRMFPNLIISGGEQGKITLSDITTQKEICSVSAHTGRIYTLAPAPESPHLLISTGSDSLIKFWSLDRLFTGKMLKQVLQGEEKWNRPLEGQQQLMKLARRVAKKSGEKIQFEEGDMVHVNDIVSLTSRRVKKTMSKGTCETRLIVKSSKRKEEIVHAAKLELYMGNPKRYCELMFTAGEFDAAVAAAPAVSHAFWVEMMKNREKVHSSQNEKANCHIVCGNPDKAVDILMKDGEMDKAFLVACAQREGAFVTSVKSVSAKEKKAERPYIDLEFNNTELFVEYSTAADRARGFLEAGKIYLAACSYISVGDVIFAERLLMRHGQLYAAFLVDNITGAKCKEVRERYALAVLQNSCDKCAFDILDDEDQKLRVVIAAKFDAPEKRESFYKEIGIDKPSHYKRASAKVEGAKRLLLLLVAGETQDAITMFLTHIKEHRSDAYMECRAMAKFMEVIPLTGVDAKLQSQIAGAVLYFASYDAIWKGYHRIFKLLEIRIAALAGPSGEKWLVDCAAEITGAVKTVTKSKHKKESRIPSLGSMYLSPEPLGHPYDRTTMYGRRVRIANEWAAVSDEEACMWIDVTRMTDVVDPRIFML